MSKITAAGVRTHVDELLNYSNGERKRNFVETVELQVALKNYDPQRDKRFSGTVRLPALHGSWVSAFLVISTLDSMSIDDLKKLNKNRKLIKKLAGKYNYFVASESSPDNFHDYSARVSQGVPGKFPTPVFHSDDLANGIRDVQSTIKFQLKKVLCLSVAVGNTQMTVEELVGNLTLSINYLVSLLKKGWQNIGGIVIKSTMGQPRRLY